MSKKKFTDGLESLFSPDSKEEISGKGTAFLSGTSTVKSKAGRKSSSSRKNFTTDLDSLLEEALQESFSEKMQAKEIDKGKAKAAHQHQQQRRPMTGLDVLIRRTVESGTVQEDRKTGTKRLTVTFDKRKIIKLKKIARIEKAYLKDILGGLVDEYIKGYEKEKGNVGNNL